MTVKHGAPLLVAVLALWMTSACDTIETDKVPRIVVEAYLHPDSPAPALSLSHTGPISEPYPGGEGAMAVEDADVELLVGNERVMYHSSDGHRGMYEPAGAERLLVAGETFRLTARWNGEEARAEGVIPPAVRIDSVRVTRTERPVRAVFVDSLFLDPIVFDSLRMDSPPPGTPKHGWAYPVEVTMWWRAPTDTEDHWIHTRLKPDLPRGSALDDFFLRSEQIKLEDEAQCEADSEILCSGASTRKWTGVYGIPVAGSGVSLPAHQLNIALIRSGEDYARFASTRRDPDRREPVSNVEGGLGIVAGIALDTLSVAIE